MYDTQSARSRNDKWDSLHHYRSRCIGDRHAGRPPVVGALLPSYPGTTGGQEHTLVSHQSLIKMTGATSLVLDSPPLTEG